MPHTRKATKHQVKDDPFLALSGASALRGFYTSGLLMHRPDEDSTVRRLEIELRNGGHPQGWPLLPYVWASSAHPHQTAVTPHHDKPPAKETHHGAADSDPEFRPRKF